MTSTIERIDAWEVLDSRGNPTVAAEVTLSSGVRGRAKVPSGASTGTHEAVELRDGDPARYGGKGVLRAVRNVREEIAPLLAGQDACDQGTIDRRMIEADGTPDKGRLGANAILAVSCAAARSAATSRGIPLWQHLRGGREARMPVPMTNIISGGHHAGHNFEFQDFLVIPRNFADFRDSLEAIVRVHRITRQVIENRGFPLTGVADEGGWGPRLPTNRLALEILTEAIEKAGFVPGAQMAIALDVASTHFYRESKYYLDSEGRVLSSSEMIGLLSEWTADFPIVSVEDALAEDDWEGWVELTRELGGRIQLVGDDLFVTNEARVSRGIAEGAANAVLVKMNQIGTLTETFRVVDQARAAGYTAVISARSGETEDDFLADLAVASGAGQIKIGSVRCSERLSKYNRLLEIAASF